MDQIKIENLEIFANHGVYPEENRLGQKFLVSCILYVDTRKAGKTDDLEASVNYGTISHLIKEKMEEKNYRLIEAVAEQLAEEILLFDEKIRKVMVEVKKPWALIPPISLDFQCHLLVTSLILKLSWSVSSHSLAVLVFLRRFGWFSLRYS